MNSKTRLLILIAFSLFLAALLARKGDLIWMALPFLAYLGMGIWQSPAVGKLNLKAARSVEKISAGGAATTKVGGTVRTRGGETGELRLPAPLLAAAAEIQIQPELIKFRPFPLRLQRTLPTAGTIPARRGGSGTNFWGVREYHPGDPLRRLDWKRAARHPNQFFTKEFEQEQIADIGLILDT